MAFLANKVLLFEKMNEAISAKNEKGEYEAQRASAHSALCFLLLYLLFTNKVA